MVNKIIRVMTVLPGLLFLLIGVRWIVDPGGAAGELGMPLLEGAGLSTQVGDMTAFFLTLGICILTGAATLRRHWFYPAMMLLGFAATMRIVSWLAYGAELAVQSIFVEVVSVAILLVATVRFGKSAD